MSSTLSYTNASGVVTPVDTTNRYPVEAAIASGASISVDELPAAALLANGKTIPTTTIVAAASMRSNGTTLDLEYGNMEGTLLASAARTTTTAGAVQTNYNSRGVIACLNITANPGAAETLTIQIVNQSALGGTRILGSVAIATGTNGNFLFIVYPGAVETIASTGVDATALPIGRTWYCQIAHSASGSWTYSLTYSVIL